VAYLALFIAVGGSAYAAATITGADVVDDSLTGADIQNKSIGGADIGGATLGSAKIIDHSLGEIDLAPNSVAGSEVINNTLTGDDINESALNVPAVNGVSESKLFAELTETGSSTTFLDDSSGLKLGLECYPPRPQIPAYAQLDVVTPAGTAGAMTWFTGDTVHTTPIAGYSNAFSEDESGVASGPASVLITTHTGTGVTITVHLTVVYARNAFDETYDCEAFGHMRKSS
jgi:hypothetical protein